MGGTGSGGNFDWGFVWGCIPVNAQGAQWDCKCIPVNAQGDQRGWLSLEMDQESSRIELVYVCVCEGGWRKTWVRVYSSIFCILRWKWLRESRLNSWKWMRESSLNCWKWESSNPHDREEWVESEFLEGAGTNFQKSNYCTSTNVGVEWV